MLSFMFCLNFEVSLYGCFDITHPQRGHKWPISGKVFLVGPQQCRVSSQDKKRERGQGVMGPYLSAQTMYKFWHVRMEERKFLSYCPDWAPVVVLCLTYPIGKIHLSLVLIQCWNPIVKTQYGYECFFCLLVMFVGHLVRFCSLHDSQKCVTEIDMEPLMRVMKEIQLKFCNSRLESYVICISKRCCNGKTAGFLPGSFPAEPLNQVCQ